MKRSQLSRFPNPKELKKSGIAEIPMSWEVVDLEEITDRFIGGGTPATDNPEYWDGEIPWMRGAWISSRYVEQGEKQITRKGLEESSSNLVPAGNILVATRVCIGNIAMNKIDIAISQDLTGIVVNRKKANPEYVYWALKSLDYKLKQLNQGTAIKGVLRTDLEGFEIPLPPLNEQNRIVDILSNVDEVITLSTKALDSYSRIKKVLMQRLLTRGIGHTRFKKTRIGEIPASWNAMKLKELLELKYGEGLRGVERKTQGKYPVYGSNGIIGFTNRWLVPHETLVIGRKGGCGLVHISESKSWPIDTTFYIDNLDTSIVDLRFLYYGLQHSRLQRYTIVTAVPGVNRDTLLNHTIALPPIEEQKLIGSILATIEAKILMESRMSDELERLKKGLMQVLLTGKVRVNV